jgi:hypothetical protein
MTAETQFLQMALQCFYPLFAVIGFAVWGGYRIDRTAPASAKKNIRIAYISLLGLCVFPGSPMLFMLFTEGCYGAATGQYHSTHQLLCSRGLTWGMPWWVIFFYSIDILVLAWSTRRIVKDTKGGIITFGVPLIYFFIVRILMLSVLENITNPARLPF